MIVGLTGGIGTGKTTVAKMFGELGASVIDMDAIGHEVLVPGTAVNDAVVEHFGADVRKSDGSIDRGKLAKIVFSDVEELSTLNKITHPPMIKIIKEKIAGLSGVVVVDAAVLFESGMQGIVEKIIVVDCDEKEQIARLVHKGMDAEEARLRIKSQMPKAEKVAMADFVIDNSGSLERTYDEVKKIWGKLK